MDLKAIQDAIIAAFEAIKYAIYGLVGLLALVIVGNFFVNLWFNLAQAREARSLIRGLAQPIHRLLESLSPLLKALTPLIERAESREDSEAAGRQTPLETPVEGSRSDPNPDRNPDRDPNKNPNPNPG